MEPLVPNTQKQEFAPESSRAEEPKEPVLDAQDTDNSAEMTRKSAAKALKVAPSEMKLNKDIKFGHENYSFIDNDLRVPKKKKLMDSIIIKIREPKD